jgi:hypothetical protein
MEVGTPVSALAVLLAITNTAVAVTIIALIICLLSSKFRLGGYSLQLSPLTCAP